MNYVCKLKNLSDLSQPGVVINETTTSRHDTTRLGEMFNLLKANYKKIHGALKFRIIGMDLSWATIHASLEVLNMETIFDNCTRIFNYSNSTETEFSKSYLASCCSHTMHRFSRGLKKHVKFLDKEHRTFACLCFSLLLNTLDLQTSKEIFRFELTFEVIFYNQ